MGVSLGMALLAMVFLWDWQTSPECPHGLQPAGMLGRAGPGPGSKDVSVGASAVYPLVRRLLEDRSFEESFEEAHFKQ